MRQSREARPIPFRDDPTEKFLLSSWSDQPSVLRAGILNYSRGDASSDLEYSLLTATEDLGKREGSKAICLITDALSPGCPRTAELSAAFSRVPVRVFAVELQRDNLADPQQRMMQYLADANAGHYSTFRSGDAMDVAFDRASCYLRRLAHHTLTAETRFEMPPPAAGIENLLAKSGRVARSSLVNDCGDRARAGRFARYYRLISAGRSASRARPGLPSQTRRFADSPLGPLPR